MLIGLRVDGPPMGDAFVMSIEEIRVRFERSLVQDLLKLKERFSIVFRNCINTLSSCRGIKYAVKIHGTWLHSPHAYLGFFP